MGFDALCSGLGLFLLAPLLLALPRAWRGGVGALLAVCSASALASLPAGTAYAFTWAGLNLQPLSIEPAGKLWALAFQGVAALASLYASFDEDDALSPVAGLLTAGAASMGVLAGDWLTFFVAWELTSVASTLLLFGPRRPEQPRIVLSYLGWQVLSGVLLMAGVLWHASVTQTLFPITSIALDGRADATLIFLAFGVKAAFPFLHSWVVQAYPAASPAGTVFLGVFSTKLAVYALWRVFAGTGLLVPIGALMAIGALVPALMVRDLRRSLAYVLIAQIGVMVIGVGLGTPAALNAVVALACMHMLYASVLFMALGVVLRATGTCNADQLGADVGRKLPWTLAFYLLAAWSSLPPLAGYLGKAMLVQAASTQPLALLAIEVAGAGTFLAIGCFVPARAFFAHTGLVYEGVHEPARARVAMGLGVGALVVFGVASSWLLDALPFAKPTSVWSYTPMLHTVQLAAGAFVGFLWMVRAGALTRFASLESVGMAVVEQRVLPAAVAGLLASIARVAQGASCLLHRMGRGFVVWVTPRRSTRPLASAVEVQETSLAVLVLLTLFALLFFSRAGGM